MKNHVWRVNRMHDVELILMSDRALRDTRLLDYLKREGKFWREHEEKFPFMFQEPPRNLHTIEDRFNFVMAKQNRMPV